jgi:hypothetical protein
MQAGTWFEVTSKGTCLAVVGAALGLVGCAGARTASRGRGAARCLRPRCDQLLQLLQLCHGCCMACLLLLQQCLLLLMHGLHAGIEGRLLLLEGRQEVHITLAQCSQLCLELLQRARVLTLHGLSPDAVCGRACSSVPRCAERLLG